jgi:predicted DCC family thiol-disulfide oxidoreductase YuxK
MEEYMNSAYPVTIYYDSSCPLCEQEMSRLKQHDHAGKLILLDCSADDFTAPAGAPSRQKMMQLLHARTADGAWVAGVPAFRLAYAGVGFSFVADWLGKPCVMSVLQRLYPVIAKNRYLIPGWFAHIWFEWLATRAQRRNQSCANGQCNI